MKISMFQPLILERTNHTYVKSLACIVQIIQSASYFIPLLNNCMDEMPFEKDGDDGDMNNLRIFFFNYKNIKEIMFFL